MQYTEGAAFATRLSKYAADFLAAAFLACALLYALSTLFAILNFGLRQPMFDQWKEYGYYLSQPFLDSVIMIENGHHPVIPALVANVEILWSHANQLLQLGIGTSCIFISFALIAWTLWKESDLPRVARSAGVMLAALGLLWLGNARMLLHGVEELHVHLVVFFVTVAAICTYFAARRNSWAWTACATVACAGAMFTFGAGAAAFPAIIALSVLLRMPWQKLVLPSSAAVVCFCLYMLVLPGHQGVQHSLSLHPLETIVVAAKWLSSPWANGWLALADPPVQPWLPDSFDTSLGLLLVSSANSLVVAIDTPWRLIATAFGFAGIAIFLLRLLAVYLGGRPLGRSETLASALCIFAFVSAIIVGVGRLEYLQANPNQIFADRYLVWPCLFWMGLVWLVTIDACRLENRVIAGIGLVFLVALPVILYPTHRSWAGWGAAVYRLSQQSAAAARSGVFDAALSPPAADAGTTDVLLSLKLLKQNHLAMFAEPSWELVGTVWNGALTPSTRFSLELHLADVIRDAQSGLPAARFEGEFTRGAADAQRGGQLAFLDQDNRVAGLAEFSFFGSDAKPLQLSVPRKRGFDGYIRDYRADGRYSLVLLQANPARALVLQPLDSRP